MPRRIVFVAGLAISVALTRSGSAEPDAAAESAPDPNPAAALSDDASIGEAREAFRLGAELARAARWDEARLSFKHSSELKPHPVTTYNIAFCDRAVGRPASALRLFQQALAEHVSGASGVMPDALVAAAKQYLAEVSARVARVTLLGVLGTALLVDGHPLETFQSGSETLYVVAEASKSAGEPVHSERVVLLLDPGTHVFVAARPGAADVVQTRSLAAGEQLDLGFTFEPLPSAPHAPRRAGKTSQASDRRSYYYAAFGGGAIGLLVGAVAGIKAVHDKSQLNAVCDPAGDCPTASQNEIAALRRDSTIATIATSVGVVGVAAGITIVLLAPRSASRSPATLGLSFATNGIALHGLLP